MKKWPIVLVIISSIVIGFCTSNLFWIVRLKKEKELWENNLLPSIVCTRENRDGWSMLSWTVRQNPNQFEIGEELYVRMKVNSIMSLRNETRYGLALGDNKYDISELYVTKQQLNNLIRESADKTQQ